MSISKFWHLTFIGLTLGASPLANAVPIGEEINQQPRITIKSTASGLQHDSGGGSSTVIQGNTQAICTEGVANGYPCNNIDLLSHLDLAAIGGGSGTDSWGWKHQASGRYFALIGRSNGTSFVEVTDPENPIYLGNLPSPNGGSSSWRDLKTYNNYLYVVADSFPDHGVQIFNLNALLSASPGTTFSTVGRYTEIGSAHNIAINEESGFAYVVGTSTCAGGLHMLDLSSPSNPSFAGCFSIAYTHDVQCVIYRGEDSSYVGREICFAGNGSHVAISDVTNKQDPQLLATMSHPLTGYSHQGWLSEDHRFLFVGDELDERNFGMNTRTMVYRLNDLQNPEYVGAHHAPTTSIDHNLYTKDGYLYQANYTSGVRILEIENPSTLQFREAAYFDTSPSEDSLSFDGAWNVYPFFDNGTILVSDISRGMFMLRPQLKTLSTSRLNGRMNGSWIAPNQQNQAIMLNVGENQSGPFAFYTWFTYLNGEPYWLVGNTQIPEGADEVTMPALVFDGLDFLDDSGINANSTNIGTLRLKVLSCNSIEVDYDFGNLGSDVLVMSRFSDVEGYSCID